MRTQRIESYEDLEVWQRGMALVEGIYAITRSFPGEERFGLTAQLRRAAVSIPSNIAEGWGRSSRKEYVRFLSIARGSLYEVRTQIGIARRVGYLSDEQEQTFREDAEVLSRMLLSLLRSLHRSGAPDP